MSPNHACRAKHSLVLKTPTLAGVGIALLGCGLLLCAPASAWANGGAGGGGAGSPGAGGTFSSPAGQNGTGCGGGGGGGVGGAGGTGGSGCGTAGTSGSGGATAGASGQSGGASGSGPGGGGGGGDNGNGAGAATISNSSALSGGAGGAGGDSGGGAGNGGGGAGGYGAVVTGSGSSTNTSTISGGTGGAGGSSSFAYGGNGGDGGVGAYFSAAGASFANNGGTVSGGTGGAAGTDIGNSTGNGSNGAGGVGILGPSGGAFTLTSSGTISGGLGGDGVTRANAISLSGDGNSVELQSSSSTTGNIAFLSSVNGNNTLKLDAGATTSGVSNVTFSAGTNSLIFGGATTYAGSTTITAGTLDVNTNSVAGTLSGGISGAGAVTATGGGTLTLGGTNSYTGGTTINSGTTLSVSSDSNLGNSSGGLTFASGILTTTAGLTSSRSISMGTGGGTINTDGQTDTFSGGISGSTALTKSGTGTLNLSGNNSSFSGGFNVTAGTLSVTSVNSLGSGTLALSGGGVLNINVSYSALIGNTISVGTGGGTLNAAASPGNITDNGAINGSGLLSITGTGGSNFITLNGTNTSTGGLSLGSSLIVEVNTSNNLGSGAITFAGTGTTLDLLQTGTIANAFHLGSGANEIFMDNSTQTLTGSVTGTGSLQASGGGALVLDGTDSESTTAISSNTTLEVGDASNPSASLTTTTLTVDSGGTLRGHGTVVGNVTNSGTVAPGGSIGTLTINGTYNQGSGDTLSIELNPTTTSKLVVSGAATLGGTLSLTPDSGTYTRGTNYTILTASGVSGTFATLTDTAPSTASFTVSYGADDVVITVQNGGNAFVTNTATRDQGNVATVLNNVTSSITSGSFNTLLNSLSLLSGSPQQTALDQIDGHIATGILSGGNSNMQAMFGSIASRLGGGLGVQAFTLSSDMGEGGEVKVADASNMEWGPDRTNMGDFSVWMQGFGEFTSLGNDHNGAGLSSQIGGGAFGFEWHPTHDDTIGLTFGAANDDLQVNDVAQSGVQSTYAFGVYGSHSWGSYVADGAALAGYNHATSQRQIALLGEQANGATDGYGLGFEGGVGYRFGLDDDGDTTLTPRFGLSYTYANENGYTETGAPGANLSVAGSNQNLLQSSLGTTLATKFELANQDGSLDTVRPEVSLGWLHNWLDPSASVNESFAGVSSTNFTSYSANPGRDGADIGAGFSLTPGELKSLSIYGRYDGNFYGNETDSVVTVGAKYSW